MSGWISIRLSPYEAEIARGALRKYADLPGPTERNRTDAQAILERLSPWEPKVGGSARIHSGPEEADIEDVQVIAIDGPEAWVSSPTYGSKTRRTVQLTSLSPPPEEEN